MSAEDLPFQMDTEKMSRIMRPKQGREVGKQERWTTWLFYGAIGLFIGFVLWVFFKPYLLLFPSSDYTSSCAGCNAKEDEEEDELNTKVDYGI